MVSTFDLPEAFILLTFTNTSLSSSTDPSLNHSPSEITGGLSLKCISRALSDPLGGHLNETIYLILRINTSETPIDPFRTVLRSELILTPSSTVTGTRTAQPDALKPIKKNIYRFLGTPHHPTELKLTIDSDSLDTDVQAALEMFDNILEQYVIDFKKITPSSSSSSSSPQSLEQNQDQVLDSNLRNHLILINEQTGQVLVQFEDDTFHIQEDPSMRHVEGDDELVVIDLDLEWTHEDGDTSRVIPLDEETWVTKSASVVRYASTPSYFPGYTYIDLLVLHFQ